ncbi:hypothetical protein ACLKA6_009819 [Drosophila palustris]
MMRRPITSGSRQAPDPFDQYLESRSMYRKHTARDASCLFRVIAEQMYDTQMLHYEVRLECVRFMTRKRRIFEKHVRGDFDAYMLDMAKPKTYGTVLELRALCYMYRRNVILFEPYNLGTSVTYDKRFKDDFWVFNANEYHFDSIYTVDYIEMAAVCQSISFKLLYKMLFKLPDVSYAVETMLHPQTFNWNNYEMEIDEKGYITRLICCDGRTFQLDLPDDTKCILENYKLCQFHNNPKPPKHNMALQSADMGSVALSAMSDATNRRFDLAEIDSLLPGVSTEMLYMCPHRLNSCVRQLLDEGITPFPYKVAKSLDPHMYRNIEFDSWNDMRKEAKRYNIYANDYNFKVGAKCYVELLIDTDPRMYTCHIQEIGADKSHCVVYVEKFAKNCVVPFESLHPVPPDEFRPWAVPHRYQNQMQRLHLARSGHRPKAHKWKKSKVFDMGNYFEASKCDVMQYLQMDSCYSFQQMHSSYHAEHQQIHDPVEGEHRQQQQQQQRFQPLANSSRLQHPQEGQLPMLSGGASSGLPAHPAHFGQFLNYVPMPARPTPGQVPPPWLGSPVTIPEEFPAGVYPGPPVPSNGCMLMHFGGFAPPPAVSQLPSPPFGASPFMFGPQPMPGSLMMPPLGGHPNGNNNSCSDDQSEVRRLMQVNGEDLPADLGTVRYFYNIGVDTHMRLFNGNNQNHHNTDQQPLQQPQQQQQKQRNDETSALVTNTTPPPSPNAVTVPAIAVTVNPSSCTSSTEPSVEKAPPRAPRTKRGASNKGRQAKRPQQLYDLNKDNQQQQLSHVMMLPTPTPSPNTNGNQFNFYPPAQTPLPTPPSMPMQPPPLFIAAHKGGQIPYAWRMPPSPGAANMVGMPFEMGNHNMDPNGVVANVQQQPQQHKPSRH